jgi:hypothetical protein
MRECGEGERDVYRSQDQSQEEVLATGRFREW